VRYAAAEAELRDVKERVAALGSVRPRMVIEEALARLRQDRRWESSKECSNATVDSSREFCRSVGDLRIELASAVESDQLQTRGVVLQSEIEGLLAAGARLEADRQAASSRG
jgi:hypothetical protein